MALATHVPDMDGEPGLDGTRFAALWQRCAGEGAEPRGREVFETVLAHYSEAHRHYHSCDHVRHCLVQFDLAREQMRDPDAVEMALWFHDVIYEPRAPDNELRSARCFARCAAGQLPRAFRERVHDLIMVTVHPSEPEDLDERFMVDIDLSSFALPWDRFKRDSQAVRREMPHMSDAQFFSGQVGFLTSLLARGAFFATEFFRQRSEAAARENVTRTLEDLRQRGYGTAG